jgi:predicted HTH domain antitoxin
MSQELEKVMEALLQAHVFPDHLTLQREAFRALLMLRPELRIEGAIALYRQGESSFARAAELCGLSQEELKHILAARGSSVKYLPWSRKISSRLQRPCVKLAHGGKSICTPDPDSAKLPLASLLNTRGIAGKTDAIYLYVFRDHHTDVL